MLSARLPSNGYRRPTAFSDGLQASIIAQLPSIYRKESIMHYKPLLLALMIGFSAPSFAAPAAHKEKNVEVKKPAKNKKEAAAKAEAVKNTEKKQSAKTKAEEKPADTSKRQSKASKKEKAAESEDKQPNKKTSKKTALEKKEKAEKNRAEEKQRTADARAEKKRKQAEEKAAEKNKRPSENEDGKQRKGSASEKTKRNNATDKNKESDKNENKAAQNRAEKSKRKNESNTADSDGLRTAVSAAENDVENKKALLNRSEGLLVHAAATLKQLQQTRINLASVNRQQRDAWEKFQKLNTDLNRLKAEIANTRTQITRFVSGNYKNSQPNAVALFLKNAEPGQKTRFLRYTRYINASNEKVVKDLALQEKKLAAQEQKINNELVHLKRLQSGIQASLKRHGVTDTAEQAESRRQNAKMFKDSQKAAANKENEQRLNKLLKDLEKRKAEQQRQEAEQRKKAAEARLAAAEKARREKAGEEKARASMSTLTSEDLNLKAPAAETAASANSNSFGRMQGRLKKPVNGTLAGLFGQEKADGNVWKGVFYATAPAQVSSIASGTVSFAGELEGYGKVVVVDHGEHYISIYSGLSEISVAQSYAVNAGSKIGTSGSLPDGEEGLYLQIRYDGQAMNPLSWVN